MDADCKFDGKCWCWMVNDGLMCAEHNGTLIHGQTAASNINARIRDFNIQRLFSTLYWRFCLEALQCGGTSIKKEAYNFLKAKQQTQRHERPKASSGDVYFKLMQKNSEG